MKKTILIVDDFKNTRFVVRFALEGAGYKVIEAIDGKDALRFFDGQPIDLLITDYNMPRLNGVELAKEVRELPQYKYIPIIVLTTEMDSRKKELAKEVNVTGWIHKPFQMDRFLSIIKKTIL